MLCLYIFYILNILVIDIKNIFTTIISVVSITVTVTERCVRNRFLQDKRPSELLWKKMPLKNYFTENIFY